MLFGKIPLPLWYHTITYREFSLEELTLSDEEAIRLARQRVLEGISDKPLVSYKESVTLAEDAVILCVTYRCIEDIAKEYPLFDLP